LDRKLDAPEFRQLKQRISLRCALRGFELAETVAYVNSRMGAPDSQNQTVIPPQLLAEIHYRAQGIPACINAICGQPVAHRVRHGEPESPPWKCSERGDRTTCAIEYPGQLPFRPNSDFPSGPCVGPKYRNRQVGLDIGYLPYTQTSQKLPNSTRCYLSYVTLKVEITKGQAFPRVDWKGNWTSKVSISNP